MTLVEFLTARLDEEQAAAQAAYDEATDYRIQGSTLTEDHFALWKPARVLAQVDAKRAILQETIRPFLGLDTTMARIAEQSLRLLASPYADHEDYRVVWRP